MDREHAQLVKELFQAAVELGQAERARLLEERCAGNAELRAELESLLRADSGGPFLEPPGPGLPHPERIGRYTIRRRIADGGMGTVFEAEQDSPRRAVALKLLRSGLFARDSMRRFEHEAHVLARLGHPGIAQVYEAGTIAAGGLSLPYFAMELIPGALAITDYAREHRLDARARLALFAQVCDAIHYAHLHGVIHRDIKPSNILVDAEGRARIIDFGVARSAEAAATQGTAPGQFIGTIPYMSPEQCAPGAREVDVRSDVYSLGVVLYELLCDRLPHAAPQGDLLEAARVIREDPPVPPSAARRAFKGDVETIVLKALEKNPERRYASAAELAADVRRFLNGEPIEARRDSTWYVLAKTIRRHRAGFAALLAFVLLLVGSSVAAWVLTLRAARAEQRSRLENENTSRISDFYAGLLLHMDPWSESGVASKLHAADLRLPDLLREGVRRIPASFKDRPDLAAGLQRNIGRAFNGLALPDEAERIFREAWESAKQSLGQDHPATLELQRNLGNSLANRSATDEAIALLKDAADRSVRAFGEQDPRSLMVLLSLNWAMRDCADIAASEQLAQRVLEIAERTLPANDPVRVEAATQRAIVLLHHRRFTDAEQAAQRAVALARQAGDGPSIYLALALDALHAALVHRLRWQEALDAGEACRQIRRTVDGPDHLNYIRSSADQIPLACLGRCEEAVECGRGIVQRMTTILGPDNAETIQAVNSLVFTLVHCGRAPEAEQLARERWTELRRDPGPEHESTLALGVALAVALDAQGRADDAAPLVAAALDHPPRPGALDYALRWEPECFPLVARRLTQLGRFQEAEWRLLEAHAQLAAEGERARERLRRVRGDLCALYDAWGTPERAAPFRSDAPTN